MEISLLMKKFGFTEYETKVYTTLLQIGRSTGYEISKMSNVPRSKVYNVLESLYQKGVVQRSNGEQVLYCAVSVDDFIRSLEQSAHKDLLVLKESLKEQENNVNEINEIWNMEGYDHILSTIKNSIIQTKDELFLQIWKEDIDQELLELLKEAEKRIHKYVLILFSEDQTYDIGLKRFYPHYFEHEKLLELHSRWINMIVDDKKMLLATIHSEHRADAVTTQYLPMVFLAKEYVKHDAYTARLIELSDPKFIEKFNKSKIRDIF